MSTRARWWAIALVAAVVAVVAIVVVNRRDDHKVGDVIPAAYVIGQSSDAELALPFGVVAIRVSADTEAYQLKDGERSSHETAAGDGRRFVEVEWNPRLSSSSLVWPTASAAARREPPTALSIRTGGRTYPVTGHVISADDSASAVVLVEGDASDLEVVATSGRHTQRVKPDTSRDQNHYRAVPEQSCRPDDQESKVRWEPQCTVDTTRQPYVAGLGWAPAGQEWLLLTQVSAGVSDRSTVRWRDGDSNAVEYDLNPDAKATLTVADLQPRARHAVASRNGGVMALEDRAYLVPAGQMVKVSLRYTRSATLQPGQDAGDLRGAPARLQLEAAHVIEA